jgi:hypothetical protein
MKDSLLSGFALSSLIHVALIPTASLLIAGTEATKTTQHIEVSLTDIPAVEQKPEPAPAPKPEPKKVEKIKAPRLIHKTDIARVEPNEPPPKIQELPPPPPNLTAPGPEKGSVASKALAGEPQAQKRVWEVYLAVAMYQSLVAAAWVEVEEARPTPAWAEATRATASVAAAMVMDLLLWPGPSEAIR